MRRKTDMPLIILLVVGLLSSVASAQTGNASTVYKTRFPGVTWDATNWILTTTNLDQGHYQSRASVANGYHGINVAALGPFFEADTPVAGDDINGWPLFQRRQTFATVGGFWDSQATTNGTNFPWLSQYGGDSAISGIPHWSGLIVDLGGSNFLAAATNASTISNFKSSLDMRNGLMNWAFTWKPSGHGSFNVSYQLFAHRLNINQAVVTMNITAASATNVTIANVLNGDCAVRATPGQTGVDSSSSDLIYSSVSPDGVSNITAWVYATLNHTGATVGSAQKLTTSRPYLGTNQTSIASTYNVSLQGGKVATFTKFVGIASTDGYVQPRMVARNASLNAQKAGFTSLLQSHMAEWNANFPSTSVDDYSYPQNGSLPSDPYIIESAIVAVVNPYTLLQNTITENALNVSGNAPINSHSIAVGGLTSDSYAGQIFWDAEVWMQPGLVAAFPAAGLGIANYRIQRYQQAQANIKTAYQSSQNTTQFSSKAAIFPWTSGRYGNCTATGPCWDYEYHINGDIGQEFTNYWVTSGDTSFFQDQLYPIYDSLATMYSDLLVKNGSQWSLLNMTDPDEYANHVDDGAFTNALISQHLATANQYRSMFNGTPNATWTTQADNVLIARDTEANIVLEYVGMNGSVEVKQADVILNTFPLSYTGQNYTSQDSLSDLDYYAAKTTTNGPAMTYAIFSIIANSVSPSGCSSYTYQQASTYPYIRGPWFQFSEQLVDNYQANGGTHPAYPFLTGHGGSNQVVLFGYLGLRLRPDFILHVDPSLPPQIPQIKYRTFHWNGWPISAFSNQSHTILSRGSVSPAEGAVPNATYASSPIPVQVGPLGGSATGNYSLAPNSSITIKNRQIGNVATTSGNVAQCLPVSSPDDIMPGQFPIAAVDGATSTKWQPALANQTASITVSLPLGYRVTGMEFDWAQAPPWNYSVLFHNETLGSPSAFNANSSAGVLEVASNGKLSFSTAYNATEILDIGPLESNVTMFTVPSGKEIYTARYATLQVWGSLANGTATVKNMSGSGATVAEWSIIVEGLGGLRKRGADVGGNLKMRGTEGDMDVLLKLGRVVRDAERRKSMV
ncbi:alpha,alpha-trehalase [Exophiala viscosa]|uniref:alpha,alpha-trehalase n=1 Tax=Exophiala viscosa TaxID=2486360 RepID=A0AAN6E800_9EURO|nr:alpha,alpha-trehalase [Exophiala viscosa]